MNVSDIMQKSVITISLDNYLRDVARLIFTHGIAGIPVVKEDKLVGIITEEDILSSLQNNKTKTLHTSQTVKDLNIDALLNSKVADVMNKNVSSVAENTSLMEAYSLMTSRKFSRLPIVDEKGVLRGIISQGDIFRELLRDKMYELEEKNYAQYIGQEYDKMVNWQKRFEFEFPTLFKIFKRENVQNILDLGVWTGEYTIGLAKRSSQKIVGFDHNSDMIDMCNLKKKKLSESVQKRLEFVLTDFKTFPSQYDGKFDAVISMGNAFPYIPADLKTICKNISKVVSEEGVIVLQLLNFEKVLRNRGRLLSFKIKKAFHNGVQEDLFIEFFDRESDNKLLHHVIEFNREGKNWIYEGITTVPIHYITKDEIEECLQSVGFFDLSFSGNMGEYQGEYGQMSLLKPFDPLESDWLNVVAKR